MWCHVQQGLQRTGEPRAGIGAGESKQLCADVLHLLDFSADVSPPLCYCLLSWVQKGLAGEMLRGAWQSAIHWFELVLNTPKNLELDLQVRSKKKIAYGLPFPRKLSPGALLHPSEPGAPLTARNCRSRCPNLPPLAVSSALIRPVTPVRKASETCGIVLECLLRALLLDPWPV